MNLPVVLFPILTLFLITYLCCGHDSMLVMLLHIPPPGYTHGLCASGPGCAYVFHAPGSSYWSVSGVQAPGSRSWSVAHICSSSLAPVLSLPGLSYRFANSTAFPYPVPCSTLGIFHPALHLVFLVLFCAPHLALSLFCHCCYIKLPTILGTTT